MLETNIRVVRPGPQLYILVRQVNVSGQVLAADLLERMCSLLRRRHGIAAVRAPGYPNKLLIATDRPLETITLEEDDWQLTASDSGEATRHLPFSDPENEDLISQLVERALLAQIARRTDLWTLDSPRIWYGARPFQCDDGIAAFRRYEIDALPLGNAGIGISVDISTAFFSEHTLDYFFDSNLDSKERKVRSDLFLELTGRQEGQKGTLLYDNGRSRVKCYFEAAPPGLTCDTTGPFRLRGETYSSVYHYYAAKFSGLRIAEADVAAQVSFPGLDRPVPVAARLLRLRVMNDDVPDSLSSVDKIPPADRKQLVEGFWQGLEPRPLDSVAPGLFPGFWRPPSERVQYIPLPQVEFAQGHKIMPPTDRSPQAVRTYFRRRLELLDQAGCYYFPPSSPRTLHCAYPQSFGEETPEKLADDVIKTLNRWTGLPFLTNLVSYSTASEAYEKLRRTETAGLVLFVLDDEPAAYYDASFNLPGWRVKRITEHVLRQQYNNLTRGAWDKKRQEHNLARGRARWDSFVTLTGLDVLQQLDAIPYRVPNLGPYEAQLIIDVGHDRKFFAVSLLIARSKDKTPSFNIYSRVEHKADNKHESINPILLRDTIVNVFNSTMRRKFDPIASLIAMRDGNEQESEFPCFGQALDILRERGMLTRDVRVDVVGIHKNSLSGIRLWEVDDREQVTNPIEGTALSVNRRLNVLACTGQATLTQGTAEPVALVANGHCQSLDDAAQATFLAAQPNWSSPSVAQRLPLPLKRTDEGLTARSDQEVRRIR